MQKKNKFFNGALMLGIGAFTAKAIGAIYRIPLTAILGSKGLGLYQMVFPVYSVMLDFSGAGVPTALSKIVAQKGKEESGIYLKTAIKLFLWLGVICAFVTAVFSLPFSKWQGNGEAYLAYIFLAPAIIFVSMISCYRGYFQGNMNMTPTAVSQIIEQVVKLVFGLLLSYLFIFDVKKSVASATFAITLSEIAALIYLRAKFIKTNGKNALPLLSKNEFYDCAKNIIKLAVPVTLIGIIIPLSQIADSFLTLNIVGKYREDATSLYGILSGAVASVVNLPVAICYGFSVAVIPAIASKSKDCEKQKSSYYAVVLTFITSLLAAILCFVFAPLTVRILFKNLSDFEQNSAINLLKLMSFSIPLLATLQTTNAVLIARGKIYYPVISMSFGVIVKIILSVLLMKNPYFNVYGGGLAIITCYFCICLINLFTISFLRENYASKRIKVGQYQT